MDPITARDPSSSPAPDEGGDEGSVPAVPSDRGRDDPENGRPEQQDDPVAEPGGEADVGPNAEPGGADESTTIDDGQPAPAEEPEAPGEEPEEGVEQRRSHEERPSPLNVGDDLPDIERWPSDQPFVSRGFLEDLNDPNIPPEYGPEPGGVGPRGRDSQPPSEQESVGGHGAEQEHVEDLLPDELLDPKKLSVDPHHQVGHGLIQQLTTGVHGKDSSQSSPDDYAIQQAKLLSRPNLFGADDDPVTAAYWEYDESEGESKSDTDTDTPRNRYPPGRRNARHN